MRFLLIIIFSFVFGRNVCAQIDSSYIGFFDDQVLLRAYTGRDFIFLMQGKEEKDYMPNNPANIGFGFSWKNTILSFGYGYGFDFMKDKNLGKTKAFDFQLQNYGRKFTFDIYIQQYEGFYHDKKDDGKDVELYPDLRIEAYGAQVQYLFNGRKFSYKAAFNQNQKQLKSAGSFLLGLAVSQTKIRTDSSLVLSNKKILRNFQIGVNGGYAYTWALGRHWFINASLSVGIHFGSEQLSTFGKSKLEVYPAIFPRVSAGYNREKWSLGLSYVSRQIFPEFTEEEQTVLNSGSFRLTYTRRLHDIPILSKILD
ncbi:DUF4421 domain-containing protein [Dysgonomonas sp. 216]|uniref:DUF4421 family protein n=1 Tax=Dysgonomonas sp. 216 TaxID=2302934 RepID=UPI0013D02085|nr:DUF4421 family protein [Dysgonomonas sp. 216]NDW18859.1 DUF4421 domain-containing protein [Dysgonomonas sp. 216]